MTCYAFVALELFPNQCIWKVTFGQNSWYNFCWTCMSFVYIECEKGNAIKSMLNGKQGTFVSKVWDCKRSVFSLVVVLLNFWKYLSNVFFLGLWCWFWCFYWFCFNFVPRFKLSNDWVEVLIFLVVILLSLFLSLEGEYFEFRFLKGVHYLGVLQVEDTIGCIILI